MYWSDNIGNALLDTDGFARVFPHLVQIESQKYQRFLKGLDKEPPKLNMLDPITEIAVTALTRPVQLTLTEVGAIPFPSRPNLVFPYHRMTHEQKEFIRNCIKNTGEWIILNEVLVFRKPSTKVTVCPVVVLTTMCSAILNAPSQHTTETKIKLCNLVLQRIQSHYPLDIKMQHVVNDWVKQNTKEIQ